MDILNEAGRSPEKASFCTCSSILWMLSIDGQVLVCIHTQFARQSHLGRPGSLNLTTNIL